MSGREAYEQLMRMNSGVKVLVASGHSTAEQSDFFARQNSHAFIQKPFKMHDISAKVQALLSA
jgi:DNA-binding NtrC family response regulator